MILCGLLGTALPYCKRDTYVFDFFFGGMNYRQFPSLVTVSWKLDKMQLRMYLNKCRIPIRVPTFINS